MSLLPFWSDLEDLWPWRRYRQRRYRSPFDDFAIAIPEELLQLPSELRELERRREGLRDVAPTIGKEGFQVCLDIQDFNPNEVTVKTVENSIIVEGKHEERPDEQGYISRQFTRRYLLPRGYDPETVTSTLSSDGVLTIKAPAPEQLQRNERIVNIQPTGPARLNVKENKAIEEQCEKVQGQEEQRRGELRQEELRQEQQKQKQEEQRKEEQRKEEQRKDEERKEKKEKEEKEKKEEKEGKKP